LDVVNRKESRMRVPGIDGKVAIVTGAARGIGKVYVQALADAGAAVVVSDILEEGGRDTAAEIERAGHPALFVTTDVTSEESAAALVEATKRRFGGVDILVNNAALYAGLTMAPAGAIPQGEWDRVLAVNVSGPWIVSRAVLPSMRERGGGVIVNQSSIGAFNGGPYFSHYTTSKAAINGLTKSLARDFAEHGVRVNGLAPGGIDTDATRSLAPIEAFQTVVQMQLIKRMGTPHDLIGPLLFLAGDASAFMTGQTIVVDGGLFMPV
jgi:NAD(P)-dependent dehydrogenase (short-subunit alcohol dehydrogenase family)